ncbi:Enhancer of polycomb-like, N-terminal [Ostreococcus tauri]|uniref:Enhancer of polycomb-like protein n=1 Tax=Ostreococcus tauri TaxID=70448 RepID=A0A096P8V3_OSTTA|nr:Enhancer of polycomb-like, N-terminal [Ostreococcus tauri]CEG00330.1 Enhancer of polycomb-like, N-terminal [Ostreococcus tauri]|eukprot:XP_022840323.1 Enhancer of polycomb-like, N-terminal [Ostreococcus tauri]
MATRQGSFRARPIDVTSQLALLRDPEAIKDEQVVQREVTHAHKALDKENEEVLTKETTAGVSEIPIPEILPVASYETDYPTNYKQPEHYLRSKLTCGLTPAETVGYVEYDLDNEDEDWLENYNDGADVLSAEKFEEMLWKLELACSEANERIMKANTAMAAARGQVISYQEKVDALGVVANLPREKALELLQEISGKQAILTAVYEYWVDKRKRLKRPILRRLQPPPAPNDPNPFNVFRPREKISRPQTRRRRENDVSSYDRLRSVRKSFDISIGILELMLKREKRKNEMLTVEHELQNLQIKLRHEPKASHEAIEQKAMDADKKRAKLEIPENPPNKNIVLAGGSVELVKKPDGQYVVLGDDMGDIAGRKRRRELGLAAIGGYPPRPRVQIQVLPYKPPPEIPDIEMLFTKTPSMVAVRPFLLPLGVDLKQCRPRYGRGGRIVFDRKDPITREAFSVDSDEDMDSDDDGNPFMIRSAFAVAH